MVKIMKKTSIIIPIYYEDPTRLDILSLKSLSNLQDLTDYDIVFITPEGLDTTNWNAILEQETKCIEFPSSCFLSTISYSSLLCSYDFWKMFSNYEYVLIYQTDGYCLGGKLSDFIEDGYDYIGAPIVAPNARWFNVPAVGNGGVSLRNVSIMMEVTDLDGEFMQECKEDIAKHNKCNGNMYAIYEDLYFAQLVPMLWEFKKAPAGRAFEFSWDMNTDVVYEMTNHKLPVFCHAFDKNIRFWQNHIEVFNDINIISDCEWKNRTGYFDNSINYQGNLQYRTPYLVGAVLCVKNENWHLNETIGKLVEAGFKRIIVMDNNEMSGEQPENVISKYTDTEIIVVRKFRGKRNTNEYDLLSEMYSYAYEHYTIGLTHVMFIDADEELVMSDNRNIVNIVDEMETSGYTMIHIPVYDTDQYDIVQSKCVRKKVKTLMRTGMSNVKKFTRYTPVVRLETCCDNTFTKVEDSASSCYVEDKKDNVYVLNHPTYTKEIFDKYKMFKGWPDRLYANRKLECNENYYYMFNNKNSTISIE